MAPSLQLAKPDWSLPSPRSARGAPAPACNLRSGVVQIGLHACSGVVSIGLHASQRRIGQLACGWGIGTMDADLGVVFSLEQGATDALELFVAQRLFEGGIWESSRTSDGISYLRVVTNDPMFLRVCGQIFAISQTANAFWLDLKREPGGTAVAWVLNFDPVASTRDRAMRAIEACSCADEIEWNVTLAGRAEFRAGSFIVI